MKVYRLCNPKYKNDLSGTGAAITGGRWNSRGTPLLYTSESVALCAMEVLVHFTKGETPNNYALLTIEIPDELEIPDEIEISSYLAGNFPTNWYQFPLPDLTKNVGDDFVAQNKFLALKVPSVIVPNDLNILINPAHPDFSKVKIVKIEPYNFDIRLF